MSTTPVWAAPPQAGPLLPIGGGYADSLDGFAEAVMRCAPAAPGARRRVNVVILPTAYSSNPYSIMDEERGRNLRDADRRRLQIEEACCRAAPAGISCEVTVVPVFTRSDAFDPAKIAPLLGHVSAVFVLGGDQTVAMAGLAGTPAEAAMAAARECGAVIAGTSAGAGMLAAEMIAGYSRGFARGNSLGIGATDLWNSQDHRGLCFGLQDALLDQHFFQRGRFGRLLNAIATPGAPSLGIGIDAYTGVRIDETRLQSGSRVRGRRATLAGVFGLYEVAVLDAGTYHAAETVQYAPAGDLNRPPVLSLRNVLVHLLAPGNFSYDLAARRSSLGAPPARLGRVFAGLRLPAGAGTLLLSGDLGCAVANAEGTARADDPVLARFRELAGRAAANVLIYADGYASERSAREAGEQLAALLGTRASVRTVSDIRGARPLAEGYTAIALVGRDQSKVDVGMLASWLPAAWRAGLPVLADNALAPTLGAYYSAHGPTPVGREESEAATQRSFLVGETVVKPGLALLAATFEPQLLAGNRWGRYFSLAYTHPELIAFGLNRGAGVEIGPTGAHALGDSVTFSLDLRAARLAAGTNGGFVIANGLVDVFAPGEGLAARPATVDTSSRCHSKTLRMLKDTQSEECAIMPMHSHALMHANAHAHANTNARATARTVPINDAIAPAA